MTQDGAHLLDVRPSLFQKGFVTADGIDLHFRRYGEGPAVVMLHAGPCSARVMGPIQAIWGHQFTTIAFDLPGFGLSQMLPRDDVRIEHLADAIAAGVRALGLGKVALYGRHTGAAVAVEIANRHPELCSMVLTDGFPVFQARYDPERLEEYLPPIVPRWDGSHLVWAWFRYREQHVFWPWDRPSLEHRADTDVPGQAFLYRGALELLEATTTYHKVYRAAFLHAGLDMIDQVRVPVCFGNRPGDSQYKTIERYPAHARVEILPRAGRPAALREMEILCERPGSPVVPPYKSRLSLGEEDSLVDYIPTAPCATYARVEGWQTSATPLLFLHDLPGSITNHEAELVKLGRHRPVLAIDLAGNGNSECEVSVSIPLWVEQVLGCLDFMGLEQVDLYTHGTAAGLAIELKSSAPARFGDITMRSPSILDPENRDHFAQHYAPDIAPVWDGGNFLRLWHHLRDQELWFPWNERTREAARTAAPRIDPDTLHARAVALAKQPQAYQSIWRTVLSYPLREAITQLPEMPTILVDPQDVFAPIAKAFCKSFDVPMKLVEADPQ